MKITKQELKKYIKEEYAKIIESGPGYGDSPVETIKQLKTLIEVAGKTISSGKMPVGIYDKNTGLVLAYSTSNKYIFDINALHIFLSTHKK